MKELRLVVIKQMFIGCSGSNCSVFYLYRVTSVDLSSTLYYAHVQPIKRFGLCRVISATYINIKLPEFVQNSVDIFSLR